MQIGRISEIWRYPVKSLGGERVAEARLEPRGIADDRCWAVRDDISGEIVGGKKIPGLMMLSARYVNAPPERFGVAVGTPVAIDFPDGRSLRSDDPYASALLSMHLGRRVSLIERPPPGQKAAYRLARSMSPAEVRYALGMRAEDPDPDFSSFSLGMLATLSRYATPPGALYDVYPLHFLTSAALNTMRGHYPQGDFCARRYRPSFVIDTDPELQGLVENEWRGRDLRIGDALIHCNHPTIRCSMPGAAQPGLPRDPGIPLAVMRHAGQHLGAYATPRHQGLIREGDMVELLPPSRGSLHVWFGQLGRRSKARLIGLSNRLSGLQDKASARAPAAGTLPPGFQRCTLVRREAESADVTSFWFAAGSGKPLPAFVPGQHVVLALPQPDGTLIYRPYSLSGPGSQRGLYRISVKRELGRGDDAATVGVASGHLHDRLAVGDSLQLKAPAGHFATAPQDPWPLVLISGGIGITPFLSILHSLAEENPQRPVRLFHCIRSARDFAFREELQDLVGRLADCRLRVQVSQGLEEGGDSGLHPGRLDLTQALASLELTAQPRYMVCGKPGFSQAMQQALLDQGVAAEHVQQEFFGAPMTAGDTGHGRHAIRFRRSGREVQWESGQDSLLALAEAQGIGVSSGCRFGACQACEAGLISGEVGYPQGVEPPAGKNRLLLCSAQPESDLEIDL